MAAGVWAPARRGDKVAGHPDGQQSPQNAWDCGFSGVCQFPEKQLEQKPLDKLYLVRAWSLTQLSSLLCFSSMGHCNSQC